MKGIPLWALQKNIDCKLLDMTGTALVKAVLFENCSVDTHTNTQILNATIKYMLTTKRFDESLFYSYIVRKILLVFLCFIQWQEYASLNWRP